jgi:hypothetical protein
MSSAKVKPPAKPPMVVHGNGVEVTARLMAAGYRLEHRDTAILIHGTETKPEDVFESTFIASHGRPFCENIIYFIAGFNERDIQNFVQYFSVQYEHNMPELFRLCFLPPQEVFSQDQIDSHGINFLMKALQKIQQAMRLLYESQQREKQALMVADTKEKPMDKMESGDKLVSRKPSPIVIYKMHPPNPVSSKHGRFEFCPSVVDQISKSQ